MPGGVLTSYGLIVTTNTPEGLKFLVAHRRDSYEYTDLLRGMWGTPVDAMYLFVMCTGEERERILSHTFDELWSDLWLYGEQYNNHYRTCRAKLGSVIEHFRAVHSAFPILNHDTPWGFPKGRLEANETRIECALREFQEETFIPSTKLSILDSAPFNENYSGTYNRVYRTLYYLAACATEEAAPVLDTPHLIRKSTVNMETSEVRWVTLPEAAKLLPNIRLKFLMTIAARIHI